MRPSMTSRLLLSSMENSTKVEWLSDVRAVRFLPSIRPVRGSEGTLDQDLLIENGGARARRGQHEEVIHEEVIQEKVA
jgi:hypothetical protein